LNLKVVANQYGADLLLTVRNETSHDWPEIAAIIPCLNPGKHRKEGLPAAPPTSAFLDKAQERTWYLGPHGLEPLIARDIHFNCSFRDAIDRESMDGKFVFSNKWPTWTGDAEGGLLLRESLDQTWVAGIAWEDYISLQGHNPWTCMHQSVRVGPLRRNDSRQVSGKIYLFEGRKEDCLAKFRKDFG
jgi:hypothetical protein